MAVAPLVTAPRPERELYDLRADPTETTNLLADDGTDASDVEDVAADLAVLLHDWRQRTGDVIPSEFAGTRIAARYTETYLQIHHGAADPAVGHRRRPGHRRRQARAAIVAAGPMVATRYARPAPPTTATTNTRRNGKIVEPSERAG